MLTCVLTFLSLNDAFLSSDTCIIQQNTRSSHVLTRAPEILYSLRIVESTPESLMDKTTGWPQKLAPYFVRLNFTKY